MLLFKSTLLTPFPNHHEFTLNCIEIFLTINCSVTLSIYISMKPPCNTCIVSVCFCIKSLCHILYMCSHCTLEIKFILYQHIHVSMDLKSFVCICMSPKGMKLYLYCQSIYQLESNYCVMYPFLNTSKATNYTSFDLETNMQGSFIKIGVVKLAWL